MHLPSAPQINARIKYITLMNDTYSCGQKKGEMGNSVFRQNSKWKSSFIGYDKWIYSRKQTKVFHQIKAKFIINNLQKFDIIPSNLIGFDLNDDVSLIIISFYSGDGLYKNIIKYVKLELKKIYKNNRNSEIRIYSSLTGPEHHDDCPTSMNAYNKTRKAAQFVFTENA